MGTGFKFAICRGTTLLQRFSTGSRPVGTKFIIGGGLLEKLKVYDPITFGFIHRNGVFGIR